MTFAVVKSASYILAHTPDMVIHNGSTQVQERHANPESEYLKKIPNHMRSFEEAVNYLPNQVYIGNRNYRELKDLDMPWCDKLVQGSAQSDRGKFVPKENFMA